MSIAHRSLHIGSRKCATALVLCLAGLSPAAFAADAGVSTYQQERNACMNGSSQERTTCLREAAAARNEARRGQLTEENASYEDNALARCKALPPADRPDCVKRVHGQGIVSGSVEGGGIYRETRTTVVEPTPAPARTLPAPVSPAPVYQRPMPASPQDSMPR